MPLRHLVTRLLEVAVVVVAFSSCGAGTDKSSDSSKATVSADTIARRVEGFPPSLVGRLVRADSGLLQGIRPMSQPSTERTHALVRLSKRWRPGDVIVVAFLGGSREVRDSVAAAASVWSRFANIGFDFWTDSTHTNYREWSRSDGHYMAHVRVAFDEPGYWSFVGREAVDPRYAPADSASLNLEAFDNGLPQEWKETVLHEFGHVLGLEHEHQNPLSTCEAEFRWTDDVGYIPTTARYGNFIDDRSGRHPGLYRLLGGPPNKWDSTTVDYNLRRFAFDLDLEATAFDSSSIMKYYFEPSFFKLGTASHCYSPEALQLSAADQAIAAHHYPRAQLADNTLDVVLQQGLRETDLSPVDQTRLTASIKTMAKQQDRNSAMIAASQHGRR